MSIRKFRIRHLQFPIRKGGVFRPGAYSLAPRHFRIAQRRTERCKERACPEPCEGRGCAEAYLCTASRSVEILPVPPASGHGQIRDSVEILAGGPTAQGRKRTLSGRKLVGRFLNNIAISHATEMVSSPYFHRKITGDSLISSNHLRILALSSSLD